MVTEMTSQRFDEEVLASTTPVLVDFWAPWCGPCRAVGPVLERIAAEREGELRLVKVNVDDEQELAVRYGVGSIPTILLFENGEPVATAIGAQSKTQLERTLGLVPATGSSESRQSMLGRLAGRFRGMDQPAA